MRILIAPDKFKGSLSAMEVCNAIERGILNYDATIETIKHPLADGGEGTLAILQNYFELKTESAVAIDPLFRTTTATYKHNDDTAFIEMANASGLLMVEENNRDVCNSTSFGTGQLILDAINKGFRKIILFIGGSATNDGGVGMAAALGYKFFSKEGINISPTGKGLISIDEIKNQDLSFSLNEICFTVVCDVKNPLYGPNGAAHVYAAQKGASAEEIEQLDLGLRNFSKQVERYLHKDVAHLQGAGAAGGMGAGAVCFLNAKMQSGIDFVMEQTHFDASVKNNVDLIITGEGSLDKQTVEGKVIKGVSIRAHQNHIPFSILAGVVKDVALIKSNLKPARIQSIMEMDITVEDAMENAAKYVTEMSYQLIKSQNDHFIN
ncbi:glycerate kinase [Flavobacterium sp. 7A]|uniref:glycerate kinase n=1 Tax=Flavobacterium sp. 7A TaxID=2940571 RepID=UPI0022278A6E|nr:glycerate kinase [Flavobacterium sp. 7A]MCW2118289.1 glycerate kinase [Flavobacterium sp. 7A]